MKQRLFVLWLALCLLLSACGGLPIQVPESAVQAAEASEAEEASRDPEELGKWLWEKMAEHQEEHFAYDMDMEMTVRVRVDGEEIEELEDAEISSRVRTISREDGTITYQAETETDGGRTSVWYDDGMVYMEDDYGSYKAKAEADEIQGGFAMGSTLGRMTSKQMLQWFGTVRGEETEDGYVLTYGDMSPRFWNLILGMLGGILGEMDEGFEESIRDITLSGTVRLDREGDVLSQEVVGTAELDILGTSMQEEFTMKTDVNCYDEQVSIQVPRDDEEFREMSDIEIPEVFSNGYNTLLGRDDIRYQDALILRVADREKAMEDTYIQQDELRCSVDFGGLSVEWDTGYLKNDQMTDWSNDTYSGGHGVLSDAEQQREYSYDDASMWSDIVDFITLYADSFEDGNTYTLREDGGRRRLTYTLSAEYAEMLTEGLLESYETGVDYREASAQKCEGSMSVWFDETGAVAEQKLEVSAELTFEAGVISVTVEDHGLVLEP